MARPNPLTATIGHYKPHIIRHAVRIDTFACAVRSHLRITCRFEESTGVSTSVYMGYSKPKLHHLETRRDHLPKCQFSLLHYLVASSLLISTDGEMYVCCQTLSPPPIVPCSFLSRQDRRHIQGILVCYYFISHLTMRSAYAVHIQPTVLAYVCCNQMRIHMWANANKRS